MNTIGQIGCAIGRGLNSCHYELLPPPPICTRVINANGIRELLRGVTDCPIMVGDYNYELPSIEDYGRFLEWFVKSHSYTGDDWDCENISLELFFMMSKWSGGKSPSGWVWAYGKNPKHSFGSHGFNFVITDELTIAYCDELKVAAPHDDFFLESEVEYKKQLMVVV